MCPNAVASKLTPTEKLHLDTVLLPLSVLTALGVGYGATGGL
ncbi:hypothetical protein [Pseudomonas sp. UBA1879]